MAHTTTVEGCYLDDSGKWRNDKDDNSSNSQGVRDADSTDESSDDLLTLIKHFDSVSEEFFCADDVYTNNKGILNLLRYYRYNGTQWNVTIFSDASPFVNFANKNYPDTLNNLMPYIKNARTVYIHDKETELAHLAATTLGYCQSPLIPNFWIGWGAI